MTHSLAATDYDTFSTNDVTDIKGMTAWIQFLQTEFNVFFSTPLDIDFAMLEAFPAIYKGQANRGPQLPRAGTAQYDEAIADRVKQVLASNPKTAPATTGSTYSATQRELLAWYKYLFVDGSKPVAHMRAMIALDSRALLKALPKFLKELIDAAAKMLVVPGKGK